MYRTEHYGNAVRTETESFLHRTKAFFVKLEPSRTASSMSLSDGAKGEGAASSEKIEPASTPGNALEDLQSMYTTRGTVGLAEVAKEMDKTE